MNGKDKLFNLKEFLEGCWSVPQDLTDAFPTDIKRWITVRSKTLAVPESYLALPLITFVSHLLQVSHIEVSEFHREPTVIYSLTGGKSGTNKSACIQLFQNLADQINPDAVFDCGSLEGLALKLSRNNNCCIVLNDQLQTLLELIEGGGKGSGERARFLTLHGGGSWTKTTQSKGNRAINETRVQICAFTQPENMATFGRNKLNQIDGLFSRFLVRIRNRRTSY